MLEADVRAPGVALDQVSISNTPSSFAVPQVSFIVATHDRSDVLRECLESFAADPLVDFEILVVDQNQDDRAAAIVQEFVGRLPIQCLRQPHPGVSAARNFGASQAVGAWLSFPDDDCRLLPSTLPTLRRLIREDDADLLTGVTVDEHGRDSMVKWWKQEASITPGLLRRTFCESTLAVRREIFWSVGGFDRFFGPGAAFPAEEGVDFIRRLWDRFSHRVRMRFTPSLRYFHADAGTCWNEERLEKAHRYARGRGACAARHWRTFSRRRAVVEIAKHLTGCVVLRGDRRRSRYVTLLGYVEGFVQYHGVARRRSQELDADQLHFTRG